MSTIFKKFINAFIITTLNLLGELPLTSFPYCLKISATNPMKQYEP